MTEYERLAVNELQAWEKKVKRRSSLAGRYAKKVQTKMNALIPDKVHAVITTSIKTTVTAVLVGSEFTTKNVPLKSASLEEREQIVKEKMTYYQRMAAAEGAGTGAGGLLMGAADFPLLLGIKMKFLFAAASIYGFNVKDYRERLYILYLFQLAFSSDEKRRLVFDKIKDWEETIAAYPDKDTYLKQIDWHTWQQEYRDHIDLIKMLQLMPGFGAIVGAVANYRFLDVLGETAMNGYRLRLLR